MSQAAIVARSSGDLEVGRAHPRSTVATHADLGLEEPNDQALRSDGTPPSL